MSEQTYCVMVYKREDRSYLHMLANDLATEAEANQLATRITVLLTRLSERGALRLNYEVDVVAEPYRIIDRTKDYTGSGLQMIGAERKKEG